MLRSTMPRVSCVTVTYGDRRVPLVSVAEHIARLVPSVERFVVVFNGVTYDPAQFVRALPLGDRVVTVVKRFNEGSAAGFAAGIEAAYRRTESEYFWLLDDDNAPRENALDRLLEAARSFAFSPEISFLSLRSDKTEYVDAAYRGRRIDIAANSFMGFHTRAALARRLQSSRKRRDINWDLPEAPLVSVGYAPYGGLLMPRRWYELAGLPRTDFVTYGDDHEYTARAVSLGGSIYLCAGSRVEDLERSWFLNSRRDCHYLLDPQSPPTRVFLSLRNRVALESERFVTSRPVYLLNAVVFFSVMVLRSVHGMPPLRALLDRVRLLARAFRDGRAGRLGPVEPR